MLMSLYMFFEGSRNKNGRRLTTSPALMKNYLLLNTNTIIYMKNKNYSFHMS